LRPPGENSRRCWPAERIGAALGLLTDVCGEPLQLEAQDHRVAAELVLEHGLTFYDASYAAIARRLGRRLLSADADLLKARVAEGLGAVR
jgi:predicted nucleic acid-binding protein